MTTHRPKPHLTPQARLDLAAEVYTAIVQGTDSFEYSDLIGPDLAYLLGEIVTDGFCTWPAERAIVTRLRAAFPETHPVWQYVEIDREDA